MATREGGVAIIIAVLGIFAFILYQILPLFRSAQVSPGAKVSKATERDPLVLGIDEWAELPFVYNGGATVTFTDLAGGRATFELPTGLPADAEVTAARLNPRTGTVTVGTADGRVGEALGLPRADRHPANHSGGASLGRERAAPLYR